MNISLMRSILAGGVVSFAFIFLTSQLDGQVISSRNEPASGSEILSLDDVVREVLTNNPSLKAATANWQAMRERIPQARAWADPRVGFDQRVARFVSVPRNAFSDEKLMVEQTLPVAGKIVCKLWRPRRTRRVLLKSCDASNSIRSPGRARRFIGWQTPASNWS